MTGLLEDAGRAAIAVLLAIIALVFGMGVVLGVLL